MAEDIVTLQIKATLASEEARRQEARPHVAVYLYAKHFPGDVQLANFERHYIGEFQDRKDFGERMIARIHGDTWHTLPADIKECLSFREWTDNRVNDGTFIVDHAGSLRYAFHRQPRA